MQTTKEEFTRLVSRFGFGFGARIEPRIEVDGQYLYECFDTPDGDEIAFITWFDGEPTYHMVQF